MLRIGRLLIGIVALAGCAVPSTTNDVSGARSCDRNGDQEQRIACDR
jgi:hypothetical protein